MDRCHARRRLEAGSRSASPNCPRSASGMIRSRASCDSRDPLTPASTWTSPDDQNAGELDAGDKRRASFERTKPRSHLEAPGVVYGSLPAGGDDGAPVEQTGLYHLSSRRWELVLETCFAHPQHFLCGSAERFDSAGNALQFHGDVPVQARSEPVGEIVDGSNRLTQRSSISPWHPPLAIDRDDRHLHVDPASFGIGQREEDGENESRVEARFARSDRGDRHWLRSGCSGALFSGSRTPVPHGLEARDLGGSLRAQLHRSSRRRWSLVDLRKRFAGHHQVGDGGLSQ